MAAAPAIPWPAPKIRRTKRDYRSLFETLELELCRLAEGLVIALVFTGIGLAYARATTSPPQKAMIPETTVEWRLETKEIEPIDRFDIVDSASNRERFRPLP